ncbi:hypothetical protein BC835DRAFT_837784 [Cytidiella melzeri]|nr:hypothetical protein BC835DRAFT_837784 [Cytidiella melzeri]
MIARGRVSMSRGRHQNVFQDWPGMCSSYNGSKCGDNEFRCKHSSVAKDVSKAACLLRSIEYKTDKSKCSNTSSAPRMEPSREDERRYVYAGEPHRLSDLIVKNSQYDCLAQYHNAHSDNDNKTFLVRQL